jgi:hypothetical protein
MSGKQSGIQAKIAEIVRSTELNNTQKQEQLRLLIPEDAVKIDDLHGATPAQLRKLREAIDVSQAIQKLDLASD